MLEELGLSVFNDVFKWLIKKADNQPDVKQWLIDQSTTINGDVNITNNIQKDPINWDEALKQLDLAADREAKGNTKPKYKFTQANKPNFYLRDEYNETLNTYDRKSGKAWKSSEITQWAKDNNYVVDRDFTIESDNFFYNTY